MASSNATPPPHATDRLGNPADGVLQVRSQYDPPNVGDILVMGFLSVNALLTRDPLIAAYRTLGAVGVAGLWRLHTVISLFTAGKPYRCQSFGSELSPSQKAIWGSGN